MHDEVPALYEVVNKLIGQTLQGGYEEHRRWLDTLHLQAGLEVDRRLTVNIRSHAAFDQLIAMEAARQEVRALDPECPDRKINDVLRAGVKVLESVFASMATALSPSETYGSERMSMRIGQANRQRMADDNRATLPYSPRSMRVQSGELASRARFLRSFLNVKPGQIRSVAEFGQHWRLRPLVTTTVLLADRERSHPLRNIAHRNPTLLDLDRPDCDHGRRSRPCRRHKCDGCRHRGTRGPRLPRCVETCGARRGGDEGMQRRWQ